MGAQKDHYTTLGILPTSEDFLVRVAYKALALRYHPDKFTGFKEEANCRMAEINEAYAVLSNPDKRRQYDKARTSKGQPENSYFDDENGDEQSGYDPLKDDWEFVLKYYEDIIEIESHLSKISRQLIEKEFKIGEIKNIRERIRGREWLTHPAVIVPFGLILFVMVLEFLFYVALPAPPLG